jgi:hypothetical protein
MNAILRHRRRTTAAIGVIAALIAWPISRAHARNSNPGVIPPQAAAYGMTYADWSAAWWQWALSLPADQNPFFDEDGSCANGANGQDGPVWFLTGVINDSGTAVRDCTVPPGKALFFPIVNVECSTAEGNGEDEAQLRACLETYRFADVVATVDGLPIQDLEGHLVESPLFTFTLPDGNVLGLSPGTGDSVANGYYLLLAPLPVGKHVLRFGGSFPDFEFSLDITYKLTVAPPRR